MEDSIEHKGNKATILSMNNGAKTSLVPIRILPVVVVLFVLGCEQETIPADIPEPAPVQSAESTRIGISPFPADLTPESIAIVTDLVRNNGNLCVVQLDDGIPWEEALAGKRFSDKLQEEWRGQKNNKTDSQELYVSIAPLSDDRTTWAGGYAGSEAPAWVREEKQINAQISDAYRNYVNRVVEYFQPDYLNLGQESGDLAAKDPKRWARFESLYLGLSSELKKKYPTMKIGISFGLPLLMKKGVLARATPVIEASDYVGISFYPYMGQFYSQIGGRALPPPPAQWRSPLNWLRQHVRKPAAICETGYSSDNVKAARWGLDMPGSKGLQAQYVAELADIAKRDGYLFVAFFLAVDYDKLARKIPDPGEILPLWIHTGFFDQNMQPKPAWESYQSAWLKKGPSAAAAAELELFKTTSGKGVPAEGAGGSTAIKKAR